MAQFIPMSKVTQRIAFAVDNMHNTARQIPVYDLVHRRLKLIKVMIVHVWCLFGGAVDRICSFDMQLHRGQRSAVTSVNQQRSCQVIANVMLVCQLANIAFCRVLTIVNLAPIVSQKHKLRGTFRRGIAASLPNGFGQSSHIDSVIIEKTPSGLRRSGGSTLTGE
jgi:hypothetical protein